MKRNAVTLLELIFVIVIISFLSVASYKGIQAILVRSYKAKETTRLSLESQITVDIISNYLRYRVPYTVIGYDGSSDFEYIGYLSSNKPILEWIGIANEAFIDGNYSGFVDMATLANDSFKSPDTYPSGIATSVNDKFHLSSAGTVYSGKYVNLIFTGSFDRGMGDSNDYNSSFGWHGHDSNESFDIDIPNDENITITDAIKPKFIYEKYYLIDSAYAIARGEDVNISQCATHPDLTTYESKNTLFLFSNYRPWKGETFCGDKGSRGKRSGDVSILMQNVSGFKFEESDYTIRIYLDINKSIANGTSRIHFSKMKVVF